MNLPSAATVRFDTITDYLLLVVYLARCLGVPKREIGALTSRYSAHAEELRSRVPLGIFDMIVHTDNRTKLDGLGRWLRTA